MLMDKDDPGHTATGSEVKKEYPREKEVNGGATDSSQQEVAVDGCHTKRIGGDNVKLRTLMFSRSAETVGHLGGDPAQTGQRPDRLHARRSSSGRRGVAVEQNPSGLRYPSSKTAARYLKANNIRTSKSCTKECEIVRADYTNDYSPGFSTFYEDILRAADESDTFTGIGGDGEGSDQGDVSLTESTALEIDNGDLEAKSDITITSRGDPSCSLPGDNLVPISTKGSNSHHERPGACRYGPKIDSSDESLDSDESDGQLESRASVDGGKISHSFESWPEEDHIRTVKTRYTEDADVKFSVSKQSNNHINDDKTKRKNQESSTCLQTSSITKIPYVMNKDRLPFPAQAAGFTTSLKDKDTESVGIHSSQVSSHSFLTRAEVEDGQETRRSIFSKYEVFLAQNQLDGDLLSHSSSRLSLARNRTTPLSMGMSEKQRGASCQSCHQTRPKSCTEKRTPYPEELTKAVTEAFVSGQFHTTQLFTGKRNANECLPEENRISKENTDKCAANYDKTKVDPMERFTNDSPGISILSLSLVKDISDSAMPQRRDHNDVILGDVPSLASRPCTTLMATPELRTSRPASKNADSYDLSGSSPLKPSAEKLSDTPSTCKVANENNELMSSLCTYTCIETYPQIPAAQKANLATESPYRKVENSNELGCTEDSGDMVANKDTGHTKPTLESGETMGLSPLSGKVDGATVTRASRVTAKCLMKSSVPPLGSHEYLPFLNKLRQEKPVKRDSSRQRKSHKAQRKVDNTKKSVGSQEEDCHADDDSVGSTPLCPVGREVPADWKPGEHASHPLTKLSAIYTPGRKVRRRRVVRKRKLVRQSPRRRDKDTVAAELNRHASSYEIKVSSPPNPLETPKSCSATQVHEAGSTDTDANAEDEVLASFEYKRRYYERLSKLVKNDSSSDSRGGQSPNPKRVTSEVGLLKTLDELYSSDSSGEGELELPYTEQPLFDIGHQTSLFNYYTTRLKQMTVLGSIAQQQSVGSKMPYIRIRKVEQEVPSALDHKRLNSLYECRMKKPTLTSKIRNSEQTRSRYSEKPDGVARSGRQPFSARGTNRSAHNLPMIANNKATSQDNATDVEESDKLRFKDRIISLDKSKTTHDAFSMNAPHKTYLDVLKSNIQHPSVNNKVGITGYHPQAGNSNTSRQNTLEAGMTFGKECVRLDLEEHDRKTTPLKEMESGNRTRMKVRFADPCSDHRERVPYEMSDDDTWCSTVNAMLLRANRVMDDVTRNDHRYPKPDSARVVSPVPPKSPTFLKELLKQDTIERKQAKGHTRQERRSKEPVVKQEKSNTRPGKLGNPLAMLAAPGASFLAIDQKADPLSTQNNSSLVYSVPIKDGVEQSNMNEKSAGVLKISIQMSKRAEERAWLTHERIKRQRVTNAEYDMKTEIKSIPKKLTPLRIPRPINFQNPDSRNLERIPMRDVLSKTLLGQSTSSQQIFQPKAAVPESLSTSRPNFLLDQHSETFRYFRGPYMHQRSSSIVPLFTDSNNNAFIRDATEEQTTEGEGQDDEQRQRTGHLFSQNVIKVPQMDDIVPQMDDIVPQMDDIVPQMDDIVSTSGLHDDRYSDEEGSITSPYAVQSPDYCDTDYSSKINQQGSHYKVHNEYYSNTPLSVTGFKAGTHSQRSHRVADTTDNSSQSYPNRKSSNAHVNTIASFSTETLPSLSSDKHIAVTDKPKQTKIETVQSSTAMSISSKPKKVYISGMPCFEIAVNGGNVKKAHDNSNVEKNKGSSSNEQKEEEEDQCDTQETLLDVLLGYEIERMSKVSFRNAELDNKQIQSLEIDNDVSMRVSSDGVSEPCSTHYLNQWAPNYLESALETETLQAPASPGAPEQTSCSVRSDEVDNEQLRHQLCAQTSNNVDTAAATHHYPENVDEKDILDMEDETISYFKFKIPYSAPNSKPQLPREEALALTSLSVLGSTIALAEKRSNPMPTTLPDVLRFSYYNKGQQHCCTAPAKLTQSSRLDGLSQHGLSQHGLSQHGRRSYVRGTSAEKRVNQTAISRPKQDLKPLNKSLGKKPANNMKQNVRKQAAQTPVNNVIKLRENVTNEPSLFPNSMIDASQVDVSRNKTYKRHFDWNTVKIPPSFIKGSNCCLATALNNIITATDGTECSPRSVYSNSSAAQCVQSDSLTAEGGSKCTYTSNAKDDITPNVDSIRDPPNSLCTPRKTKDITSPTHTNEHKLRNMKHSTGPDHRSTCQIKQEDLIAVSNTPVTTEPARETMSARSRTCDVDGRPLALSRMTESRVSMEEINTSDVDGGSLSLSRMTESGMSQEEINTTSEMSDSFDEDEGEMVALKDPAWDTEELKRPPDKTPSREVVPASEYKQWRKSTYFNQSMRVQTRATLKSPSDFLDREFLKSLRNTDLVHTVSTDQHRLFKSLQLMTRRQGYLPMFQVKSHQATEMMPQIVVLNHCAKTFIERGSSSFSGTARCLPIFYTEDHSGVVTSIYTVNWIPEGVYSLKKSPIKKATSGEEKTNCEQQATFGKLLQYSPFASDLAFSCDQAYLIGDEVSTREAAAKTLTAAHDEAGGDVAKYFMLMCGWVPPHLSSRAPPLTTEAAREETWKKADTEVRSTKDLIENAQYHFRELHPQEFDQMTGSKYSEPNIINVADDKVTRLPQIAPAPMVAAVGIHSAEFEPQVNVLKLPDICQSTRTLTPEKTPPAVMLCLRCGVTVECVHAQTDEVIHPTDRSVFEKWQTPTGRPMNINVTTLQGRYGSGRCRQRSCHHSWEVSEVGLALPLLATMARRVYTRVSVGRERTSTQYSSKARRRWKLSPRRTTKSQTECEWKSEFHLRPSTLPQVRSQPDIHRARYSCLSIDTSAEVVSQIKEYPRMNSSAERVSQIKEYPRMNSSAERVSQIKEHPQMKTGSVGGEFTAIKIRQSPRNKAPEIEANKEIKLIQESARTECLSVNQKNNPTGLIDVSQRQGQKSPAAAPKLPISPRNQKRSSYQAPPVHPAPIKHLLSLKQQANAKQNPRPKESTPQAATTTDKDKVRDVDPSVAGWTWSSLREVVDEEEELMAKRTWSQAVIPPPFPGPNTANSGQNKGTQKPTGRQFQSRKKHLAQHRRNLNQINHSYVSPYYAKKEVKRARSKTPVSDSGDDHSSISRITTNSGLSSSSSESNTEGESSTEESDGESGSSDSGSDFFTRYANKGGPTSVDDIFKRTLPRHRLDFKLARMKEVKEKEEIEQLGYLRGREGATPPPQDRGDNVKENEQAVSFLLSEYDMCSDVEEIKELWKECFPEVDFWDRQRRKKFKKTKILS